MNLIPKTAEQIEIEGATVPFYKYIENGIVVYHFDSSICGHPEPMINAMRGLQTISGDQKLVMINSKAPMGLFPKIELDFDFEILNIEDALVKIVFTKKNQEKNSTNFNDTACGGVGCS